jgi:hypothetical protein
MVGMSVARILVMGGKRLSGGRAKHHFYEFLGQNAPPPPADYTALA